MQRAKTPGREWYELAAQIHEQAANDALNRGEMTKATLYAKRAARARQEIAVRIGRVAQADMAETVEHALMGDDAIGKRELVAGFGKRIGHLSFDGGL